MRCLVVIGVVCAACGPGARPIVEQRCIDGTAVPPTVPPAPLHPRDPITFEADPTLVEGHRISGNKNVVPDRDTMKFIHNHRVKGVVTSLRLCIDEKGVPEQIDLLTTSCFPRYEDEIRTAMFAWRYSEYSVNGVAVPVCTAVTFKYSQH